MKSKRLFLFVIPLAVLIALCFWFFSPVTLLNKADAEKVQKISVFNGSTGKSFAVENEEDLEAFLSPLRDAKFKRGKWSDNVDGFVYSLTFFDADGNKIEAFIINSSSAARKDPFFYEVIGEHSLCFDLLKEWEAKYCFDAE